jgi:tetratricopeptide (TPR) repeat protein
MRETEMNGARPESHDWFSEKMRKSRPWLWIAVLILVQFAGLRAGDLFELRGRVMLPDGRPLKDGFVFLEGATSPFSSNTRTGLNGSFKFKKLDAAMYRLQIVTLKGEMERSIEIGPSSADKKGRINIVFEFDPSFHSEGRATVSVKQLAVPEEAEKEYRKAIKALNRKETEEAVEHLRKALELAPHFSTALNRLGTIFYLSQDYRQAEDYFRRAHSYAPDNYPPVVNLGAALLSLGELEAALEMNRRAVEMRPEDPLARSQLGQTYWALGDLDSALKELKHAKALDPGHFSYPQLVLAEIYDQRKDYAGVTRELEEFLKEHPDSPISGKVTESLNQVRSKQSP